MFHAFWSRATQRIAHHLQQCAADPVRSVVLLPFAQLLPLARQQWALTFPDSLLPRFETSTSWARRLRPFVPGATDLAFDAAMDLLTAQTFLQRAGLAAQAQWLNGYQVVIAQVLRTYGDNQLTGLLPTAGLFTQGTAPH